MLKSQNSLFVYKHVCVCVLAVAWVCMYPQIFASTHVDMWTITCSWTLTISLVFDLPHSFSMDGHFWTV